MTGINRDKRLEDEIDSRVNLVRTKLAWLVADSCGQEKLKNEHLDETDSNVIS